LTVFLQRRWRVGAVAIAKSVALLVSFLNLALVSGSYFAIKMSSRPKRASALAATADIQAKAKRGRDEDDESIGMSLTVSQGQTFFFRLKLAYRV
jgi:hypothetical protein